MRCIASYDDRRYPPLLSLSIHDAPHRRMHVATIQQYRGVLYRACQLARYRSFWRGTNRSMLSFRRRSAKRAS
mgnify:CR=1 FL=1